MTALAVIVALVGALFVVMQTASAAPDAPTKVVVKQGDVGTDDLPTLNLSWTKPAGTVIDYDVQVRTKAAPTTAVPDPEFSAWETHADDGANDLALTRTFGGLADGTTYQYRVRAADGDTDADESPYAESGEIVAGQLEDTLACKATTTLVLDSPADNDVLGQNCTITIDGGDLDSADFSGTPATSEAVTIEGDGDDTDFTYTITAKEAGTQVFKITGKANNLDVSKTYTFTVVAGSLLTSDAPSAPSPDFKIKSVTFNDSDGVVKAGTPVKVTVTTENGIEADADESVTGTMVRLIVPTTGLSISTDAGTTQSHDSAGEFNLITVGAPAGDYTLTVTADRDGDFATRSDQVSTTKKLTVGDPGGNVSTASLALASLDKDKNPTSPSKAQSTQLPSAIADDDTRDGKVLLSLSSLNSLGKVSNASATSKISVTVTAVGANITLESATEDDGKSTATTNLTGKTDSATGETSANGLQYQSTGPSSILAITKAKPGTVSVSALIVDARGDGFAASESITLTFTGPVDSITVGDASGTLHNVATDDGKADDTSDDDNRDKISFSLSAQDKSGNPVGAPSVTYQITDPDGNNVASSRIDPSQGPNAAGHPNAKITLASMGTAARPLASGDYTIKVSQSSTISTTATFTVAGSANSVELAVSDMTPDEVGDIVEVTATVTDADGNAVANGTPVTFASSDQTADTDPVLARIGDTGAVKTKGGEATATYVAVGDGKSVVTAVAGTKNAVAVIVSSAGAVVVEEEAEVVSLDCLTETSGFSVYSCGVGSSASELFGLLSGRGATAIHLWNGSAWVRYSVVDGTAIPGSSDFTVAEDDILYISN